MLQVMLISCEVEQCNPPGPQANQSRSTGLTQCARQLVFGSGESGESGSDPVSLLDFLWGCGSDMQGSFQDY